VFNFFKKNKKVDLEPKHEEILDIKSAVRTVKKVKYCPDCGTYLLKDVQMEAYFCPCCPFSITYEKIKYGDKEGGK